jgi:hypothetical protein
VGHFFPCAPDCEEAISRGREYHEHLTELASSLGELYASLVVENLDRVRRQPEIISSYRARAEEKFRRPLEWISNVQFFLKVDMQGWLTSVISELMVSFRWLNILFPAATMSLIRLPLCEICEELYSVSVHLRCS